MRVIRVEEFPFKEGDTVVCIRKFEYNRFGKQSVDIGNTQVGERYIITELRHTLDSKNFYESIYVRLHDNTIVGFCFDPNNKYFFKYFTSVSEYRKNIVAKLLEE